jgi:predicted component of type VI protein secretion system
MKLVIEDEAGTRSVVPFAGDEIVVGRAADGVTVRLPDRDVSRRHARFVRASGAIHVEDLGSLTGTRVNGERVAGRRRLREGDLVEIGDYDLAVLPEGDGPAPGAPPPLPAGGRAEVAVAPRAPPRTTARAIASPRPTRSHRRVLLVAALALAAGVAAGVAAGLATRTSAPVAAPASAAAP